MQFLSLIHIWTVNLNGRYGAYNKQRYGGTIGFNAGKFNSVTNVPVSYTHLDVYKRQVNAIRTVVKMPDGGFWFGTRQGNVYAYDKTLEAASCYKMPYNYIYAASCDGDGKLWRCV